ncbi:MAG: HAMP domain-containing protein [Chloroflexi bacterium]|nr:HAMP domain-containing protein [Chloroflexota bacterium]
MFKTLQSRLLLSYVIVIAITLVIGSLALTAILFLSTADNPVVLQAFRDAREVALKYAGPLSVNPDNQSMILSQAAQENDIRTLSIRRNGSVLYDSAGELTGQMLNIDPDTSPAIRPRALTDDIRRGGMFSDPNTQAQYVYVVLAPPGGAERAGWSIFAVEVDRSGSLFVILNSIFWPMAQAGVIALLVSLVLALVIANSVSRPLARVAATAHAIAGGDYSRNAPVEGPQEVREMAYSFNHMVEQVQRTQKAQQDFLANVSHDLKTPLTSIQGFAQAILDGATQDPGRAARVIYDEAARMRRMVDDLLDLARLESRAAVLARDYVDLSQLLNNITDHLSIQAGEKDIVLETDINGLPQLTGDGDRLAQVFTNLVDNAITHTPQGGQVTVRAKERSDGVVIAVSDTGPGIPAEDLPHIFERFYQVDKSRARSGSGSKKGTGLGLTIVRELVEAHGGKVGVQSQPGAGTTFKVWLPLPRPFDETIRR